MEESVFMNIVIILAHPEPKSFNAHLAAVAEDVFSGRDHQVQISDLYQSGFDACEGPRHFTALQNPDRFDAQREQRHSWECRTTPIDVQTEIDRIFWADLVVFQFPLWWFGLPAILKGWVDRVFVYGGLYTSSRRHDRGPCAGKTALFCVTTGASESACNYNGPEGDTRLILWPNLFSLRYVGFNVLEPFIFYGVRGGLTGDALETQTRRLIQREREYTAFLSDIDGAATVEFNSDEDWDNDGRLKPSAQVYSPFIRHREDIPFG